MEDTNSLIQIRIDKINEIRNNFGINPFPYKYDVTHYSNEIISDFDRYFESQEKVSIAGRIMAVRIMGKASFCTIQDKEGKIQLYIARCQYR